MRARDPWRGMVMGELIVSLLLLGLAGALWLWTDRVVVALLCLALGLVAAAQLPATWRRQRELRALQAILARLAAEGRARRDGTDG